MIEFGALVTTIKATVELAKSAKDADEQAKVNAAVSEIMEKLMAVQSELFTKQQENQALLEEVRLLKAQIENDQRFERYRLVETPMGDFIFELREEHVTEDEPAHAICVHCREGGRLSILSKGDYRYRCRHCLKSAWLKPTQKQSRSRTISSGIR